MPSHLRNGKDLSFEQQRSAERAAELETERARQQRKLAETSGHQSAFEHPSSTYQHSPNELPSSVNHSRSVEHYSAVNHSRAAELPIAIGYQANKRTDPASHRSAAGGYPPVGYTLSPAALERLCRTSEQQPNILDDIGFQPVKASPPSSGETANPCLKQISSDSLDGQAYDTDTDSPLSPHELSSLESRAVHQSLAPHSNQCPDHSQANNRDSSHHGYGDTSACLPGSYTSPRPLRASSASSAPPASCASCASTATPANTAAEAAATRARSDCSPTSTSVHGTRY
ncbi:hypothetical protein PCANC_02434 [Puccinia coronata f. sp. avenae]|uniref:Uncharacterized protein n=1 Tax=Puccinia coronata f. sp. avenae TaxID=200324 RepID=A0A2N5W4Y2_9BASI|nr:hypothetical protein PCANC_02434 [Puccinia coronata f. sp. avenae]